MLLPQMLLYMDVRGDWSECRLRHLRSNWVLLIRSRICVIWYCSLSSYNHLCCARLDFPRIHHQVQGDLQHLGVNRWLLSAHRCSTQSLIFPLFINIDDFIILYSVLLFTNTLYRTGFWGFGEIGRASCRERV